MAQIKFIWNGIKINGEFYGCIYSAGPYEEVSDLFTSTVTLYVDNWRGVPRLPGLEVYNDSDAMRDYSEMDTIRIRPGTEFHADALAAFLARQIHDLKMDVTRLERMAAKYDGTDSETFYRRELEQTRARLAAMADEAREAMNVRTIKLANGGVVRMSYAVLCKRLGFRSDIHFVEITNSGTITFTCGKPREVSGLLWAVRDAGFIPAASLQRNGE